MALRVQDPDTAWRLDEATFLAGLFADVRAREAADAAYEAAKNGTQRPEGNDAADRLPDGVAEITSGPGGMSLRGSVPVTNDRTEEEIAASDAWAAAQGWKVRRITTRRADTD